MKLIDNGSATGSPALWAGGSGVFAVVGTFGGATVKLQFLGPNGTTWIDVGGTTVMTAAGGAGFVLPCGQIRGAVTGGSPSGIYASAEIVK